MPVTNNNKKMVDLPFFELCNQSPTASGAVGGLTTAEDGDTGFIYYIIGGLFYRYDSHGDTWQLLASPHTTPITSASLRYTSRRGFHGRVISATSTTVNIPGLRGPTFNGKTIEILYGTGAGETKTLTYTGDTTHDAGVITATTTSTLGDGTKKWKFNQWAGYTVAITFGVGATLYKKILYNDQTTLYIADANLQAHDPWNNQIFTAATPYALPVITAGSQAMYQIMSSQFTVDTSWTSTPNVTSFFTVRTGGLYLLSSAAAAPFYTLQYYDVANDTWQTKTTPQSLLLAAYGTDITLERTGKIGSALISDTATGGSIRTLVDSSLNLEPDRYANHRLWITGGVGQGQNRRIAGHNATTFTVARNWDTAPTGTSTFEVWPDSDRVYIGGGGASALFAYSPENDYTMQGQAFDDGITNNISCTLGQWLPCGVSTGVRIAAGVQAVNSVPTAGGSGYSVGDILTCSVGGTGAQVIVTSIAAGGAVTGIELVHSGTGTGFTVGTGRATTGGTGTLCTINITTVGPTALITLASAHFFRSGNSVTFAGCTEGLWNAAYTIIGVNSISSFSVATTATANMVATASQSTTVIVDPTKNWVVNEHVGRLVHLMVAGQTPTSQIRWITSNTATSITVATIVAGGNGTSKYVIYDAKAFGADDQRKETDKKGYGWASGGSITSLSDSTKNWIPNQWVGYLFKIEAGAGYGTGRISITSNTENTLNFASIGVAPDTTTKYEIADTWGLNTAATLNTVTEATTKNWTVNQWAGKRVRITAGTLVGTEIGATASTATTLAAVVGTPDSTSAYVIYSIPPRSTGTQLVWAWNSADNTKKARFMYFPRGGATNQIDVYDITTGKFQFGYHISPQSETLSTGSSYAYDGVDNILFSKSVLNQPIRIFAFNAITNTVTGFMTTTVTQNVLHVGNYMEIVDSPDGIKYLYTLQNTGTVLQRSMIF
jgi:hypothetical protein